ncbi:MAG: amidohydrolase [Pirellulales bacterium]|nr:amidohydrolase [Pirellulales bacterium]
MSTDTLQAQTESKPEEPLDGRDGRELLLRNFRPKSMLALPNRQPRRAKFPVVDVHTHPRLRLRHDPERLADFVKLMDAQNIAVCVSLDATLGDVFEEHTTYLWKKYKSRFVIFANIDWRGDGKIDDPASWACNQPGFARLVAAELAEAKESGASGLKLFKRFGLAYRNPDGTLIKVDDRRWDPIWEACGKLGLPVLIHTADPAAFFLPIDETNERWEELSRHPDWSFYGPQRPKKYAHLKWPSRGDLLAARNRVIERHPKTNFIGAHLANNPEDLATVAKWFDRYPNLYADVTSRIAELGRQPYTARKFFIKYSDRILFGTDGPRVAARLLPHWRFFETMDENFAYAENPFPPQGLWNIHGLGLPDDVLGKLYHENAARLIPGVKTRLAEYVQAAERIKGGSSRSAARRLAPAD